MMGHMFVCIGVFQVKSQIELSSKYCTVVQASQLQIIIPPPLPRLCFHYERSIN